MTERTQTEQPQINTDERRVLTFLIGVHLRPPSPSVVARRATKDGFICGYFV